jgi:hypothetical protein
MQCTIRNLSNWSASTWKKPLTELATISIIVQALRAFGVPEIMIMAIQHYTLVGYAFVEVNGRSGILITIKTGSGQGDPLSSILFLFATEPLNRLLATSFPELMYVSEEGVTVGPVLYADDNLTPLSLDTADQLGSILDLYCMIVTQKLVV